MKAYLYTKVKPGKHWYAYDIEFDGDLTDSRDPTHDLARVLLARGIKGKAMAVAVGAARTI